MAFDLEPGHTVYMFHPNKKDPEMLVKWTSDSVGFRVLLNSPRLLFGCVVMAIAFEIVVHGPQEPPTTQESDNGSSQNSRQGKSLQDEPS